MPAMGECWKAETKAQGGANLRGGGPFAGNDFIRVDAA